MIDKNNNDSVILFFSRDCDNFCFCNTNINALTTTTTTTTNKKHAHNKSIEAFTTKNYFHDQKEPVLIFPVHFLLPNPNRWIFIMRSYSPKTFITKVISGSHEHAVERDEGTYLAVYFEGNYTVLACKGKGKIPHETSLLIWQQTRSYSLSLSKQVQSIFDRSE